MNRRHIRLWCIVSGAVVVGSLAGPALGQTWVGPGTDWNTASNWTPAGVPTVTALFTGNAVGTVNISGVAIINELDFNNPTGAYTLASNAGKTLSCYTTTDPISGLPAKFPKIMVAAAVTGTQTINLANIATGSLLFDTDVQILNNSTAAGTTLVIGPTTVIGTSDPTAGVSVSGSGNTKISGSFASGANQVMQGLTSVGPGTLTLSGNGANLLGGLGFNGGMLVLDYSANTAPKVGGGALSVSGGVLSLIANATTPVTQSFSGGTFVGGSQTDIQTGAGTLTLALGAIFRSGGATLDVAASSGLPTFHATTTTTNTNRLLGAGPAFATFAGGSTWAMGAGTIGGLSIYDINTYGHNLNVDVTASSTQAAFTVNSLRFNAGNQTLTLTAAATLQSGGILVTGNATGGTITGGTITAPSSAELLVHQYSTAAFTINSALVSTAGLTKTGFGTLILSGNNSGLVGPISINRGNLTVTNLSAVNAAQGIAFFDNRAGAVQTFTVDLGNNVNGTISPAIGGSLTNGVVFSTGTSLSSRITLAGQVNFATIQLTGDASNSSGFNLTATSSGAFTLSHGFLGIAQATTLTNSSFVLNVADAASGGLEFLGGVVENAPISFKSTTRILSDGTDVNTINSTLTSTGSGAGFQLVKAGTGTLILAGNGSGQLGGLTLSGGTLQLNYAGTIASKTGGGTLTLNGGLLALVANTVTPATQTIPGGTVVAAGHTDLVATSAGGGTLTLNLGSITRNLGATLDISVGAGAPAFSATTSTGNTNGLLGGGPAFATFGAGATWATAPVGTITGLGVYGTNVYGNGVATDVTSAAAPVGFTTNALRFNAGTLAFTMSGTNTLQSGGILVTPSATGGMMTGGVLTTTGGELLVHQYSGAAFTINAALVSTAGLTKTGPGTLVLGGTNTGLTGPINVNRGPLTVTAAAAVTSASQINLNDAGLGTNLQQFTADLGGAVNGTISAPIRMSAFSATDYGTYFSTGNSGGSIVTLSGVLSSAAGLTTSVRFTGDSTNFSGFNLTNTNTFTGNISLLHGSLGIAADACLGNAANTLFLEVKDLSSGGLVFLNGGITVTRPIVMNATRIVSNGTDSNTISGAITGTGGITKDGAGTLTLTNAANTVSGDVSVLEGTLSLGASGGLPIGTNVSGGVGATFSPATALSAPSIYGKVSLSGATFRVPTGSLQTYVVNQIAGASKVDFTGAGTDTLEFLNPGAGITDFGFSVWLSPANLTHVVNGNAADLPINIVAGAMLTNGIALTAFAGGFRVTGGGTLFQNCDATNGVNMTAPVTVSQGIFQVVDASSNGGVGNLGTGLFTLDGGTFSYAGATAATSKAIALTASGGAIGVESAATVFTAAGVIAGLGGLTKIGPGTLVLANAGNSFPSLTVTGGTLQTASDATLGAGPITVGGVGTLNYAATTTTSRTFNLNFGTLAVGSGATLTMTGATVIGGFMTGPGTFAVTGGTVLAGVTTSSSSALTVTGPATFINVTHGGTLSIADGLAAPTLLRLFTTQGSGSITIGAASAVNAADFQTYGTLTLTPAVVGSGLFTELVNTGSSPLYFNGGSRTFIGTAATVGPPGNPNFVAGIDLHGQNAVVAGGLFVNNGFVADSGTAGTATVVADFGALVKGAGFFQNPVVTQNGGKFQAGNSPGTASFGRLVLGPGGVSNYVFAIDDATGVAGPSPDAAGHVSGWGLIKAVRQQVGATTTLGDFIWTATPADKLMIALDTLVNPTIVGTDVAGPMADFDPTRSYSWPAAEWAGTYSGPTDAVALNQDTAFDTSGFLNPVAGSFGWTLSDSSLSLSYTPTPVPEPGTLALAGLAAVGMVGWRRGRRR